MKQGGSLCELPCVMTMCECTMIGKALLLYYILLYYALCTSVYKHLGMYKNINMCI